jgi:chromosome segregation ATPase
VLVSSIHNLVIDLTVSTSYRPTPAQITPQQLPSIETLTACLETVFSLLLRHKSPVHQSHAAATPDQQAYAAHLASLRHSLSTLQLAHTSLTKEHALLLAAYSRSQTRAKTLEQKLVVCTEETESLSNERERLMGVVESLEDTLVEVRDDRDELRVELRKTGAQWGAIVQNAGLLTMKAGAVELALTKEVAELREEVQFLRNPIGDGPGLCTLAGDAGEKERRDLKLRVKELERCLDEVKRDGRGIWELAEKMAILGRGISECR